MQGFPLSKYLFHIKFEDIARVMTQLKATKKIQIRKEQVKVSLFSNLILYIMTLKISPGISYK